MAEVVVVGGGPGFLLPQMEPPVLSPLEVRRIHRIVATVFAVSDRPGPHPAPAPGLTIAPAGGREVTTGDAAVHGRPRA